MVVPHLKEAGSDDAGLLSSASCFEGFHADAWLAQGAITNLHKHESR